MTTREEPLGCSGLLRVAGLPIRYWLSGASSGLFEKVRRLDDLEHTHLASTVGLAERLGRDVVPHPALTRADRAFVLGVRRRLHRGDPVGDCRYDRLSGVLGSLRSIDSGLVRGLLACAERERGLARLAAEVTADLADEQARLWGLPGAILDESPVSRAFLPADPDPAARLNRQRFEHAWRRIARAATSSTPRDWLSHVALLPVAASPVSLLRASPEFAARWTENVRAGRRRLRDVPAQWPPADAILGMTPLRWQDDGRLTFVVLDALDGPTRVSVRHTPLLGAICAALAGGGSSLAELAEAVGGDGTDRSALRGFVRHLATLGIVHTGVRPRTRLQRPAEPACAPSAGGSPGTTVDGWVDVYRTVEPALPVAVCQELQWRVSQALRILALASADQPATVGLAPAPTAGRWWPVTDILRAQLTRADPPPTPVQPDPGGWPSPVSAGSGYARLIGWLAGRLGDSPAVDIGSALLDELGAPAASFEWPVDCLLRLPAPGSGFAAVLGQFWPPGTIDSRFLEALRDLHGEAGHAAAYRTFIRELEQLTGVLFVEILAPPLSDAAANAVRRPLYTRAWTGDPHVAAYLPDGVRPGRYIPLEEIHIRRADGRLYAEVDGQPIWPVYHATRSFSPPWDELARVLLAAAPIVLPWAYRRLDDSLALFPGRPAVPRITVDGTLVLAPAQYRIRPDELWDPGSPPLARVRALSRLRTRRQLPRWVWLARTDDQNPAPCDLESLPAIRALERFTRTGQPIRMVEMLPSPEQLLVEDGAHRPEDRLVSEVVLRFPYDQPPAAVARRAASRVRGCRDPPADGPSRPDIPLRLRKEQ